MKISSEVGQELLAEQHKIDTMNGHHFEVTRGRPWFSVNYRTNVALAGYQRKDNVVFCTDIDYVKSVIEQEHVSSSAHQGVQIAIPPMEEIGETGWKICRLKSAWTAKCNDSEVAKLYEVENGEVYLEVPTLTKEPRFTKIENIFDAR